MVKQYIQIIAFFICLMVTILGCCQTSKINNPNNNTIVGLNIYPNPVSNGKLSISSTNNLTKYVEIFDVLGKKVYSTTLSSKMMDVSRLNIGVYIIKITENNNTVTRKFVIK
jgi:hypothetical protein